jgi:tripartite-type tricarboxylate transporter receptor subunit TctC
MTKTVSFFRLAIAPAALLTCGRVVLALLAGFHLTGHARAAAPDAYPTRPIRLIVPFAPGGNADIQGRYMAERLTEALGKQVVVDNRPGANAMIGTALVAKAPADGYTMLLVAPGHAVNPGVSKLPYDTLKDLQAISLIGSTPLLFVAHPGVSANSVKELIALAKTRPGALNFGSSGNGSPANLAGALLNLMAGIQLVHVPYKGTAQATIDVIGGQIQLAFPSMTSVLPHVKAKRLKAYSITAARRSPLAPGLPTMSEAGVPGYQASIWNGLLVPAGTPMPIVTRLNQTVVDLLKSREAGEHYASIGAEVLYSSPAEFDAFIRSEMTKWAKVIRDAGIRIDLGK